MPLLGTIPDAPGYLKSTFQGPQGSGKTWTAADLACTVHKLFASTKPIAFYDTETGSDYVKGKIAEATGTEPIRIKTRAFSDLMGVVKECVAGASDVLLVDSITHVWRELQAGYMQKINEGRRYEKTRMEIQDIMAVKLLWEPWPDLFLNAPIHIIVCGREGNEWGSEEDEETGKRSLVATGKKMKVEAEFGYEGSLMVAMKAHQFAEGVVKKKGGSRERTKRKIVNRATVLKDRFNAINGHEFDYPTGKDFMPHLQLLNPASHRQVDTSVKSHAQMGDVGDNGWALESKTRTILCEEIQGLITTIYPGQTTREKLIRLALMEKAFNTRSWTAVESKSSDDLRIGLAKVRGILSDPGAFEHEVASGTAA